MENEIATLKSAADHYLVTLINVLSEIRQSDRPFHGKICALFAMSIDFDPKSDIAKSFLFALQRKFHWATECQERCNESLPSHGLGAGINKDGASTLDSDFFPKTGQNGRSASIAELDGLVARYIDFALLQAQQRRVMEMQAWTEKFRGLLVLNDSELSFHPAKLSLENWSFRWGGTASAHEASSPPALPPNCEGNAPPAIRQQRKTNSS